ncbi:serine/threonine-protein kinase [Synechocystis sp. PCC 7509]|uniref:serine/threonine-protein kinase n=1 Tax=Synechocystis sp. PCC 7509 TaxID=927677 RepID=UPI0002AC3685|nr:serine/threonine-protein kinase [Synechocystis sp. PCC 7509]
MLENQGIINTLLGGRYCVVKTLGSGGFSKTYVAQDTHRPGNPQCVVKHLQPANTNKSFLESARRLFNCEAETLEKLGHHDRIPRLLAYFEENQEFYLVQEFIQGQLLVDKLQPNQRWTENQVWEFIREILEILVFIHDQGFIHRDIKPNNIIQRHQDNKLVLVDFGAVKQNWAQLLSQTSNIEMPATVGIGTPGYMPMEQARGRPRPNSDIYALGAIAVQALTGLYPMQIEEDFETGELLWRQQAQVSDALAVIITKMVRYHFKDRYESATDALTEIEQLAPLYLPTEINLNLAPTQLLPEQNLNSTQITTPTFPVSAKPSFNSPAQATNKLQVPRTTIVSPPKSRPTTASRRPYYRTLGAALGAALVAVVGAGYATYWQPRTQIEQTLEQLENLKVTGKYSECIVGANAIPKNSSLYINAQNVLHECKLIEAKRLAANNNFKEAIALVSSLPKDTNAYNQAKPLVSQWSNSILDLATDRYQAGKLKEAIVLAQNIPANSSVYQKAQASIKQWQAAKTAKNTYYSAATVNPTPTQAKPTTVINKKTVVRSPSNYKPTTRIRSYSPAKKIVVRSPRIRSYSPAKKTVVRSPSNYKKPKVYLRQVSNKRVVARTAKMRPTSQTRRIVPSKRLPISISSKRSPLRLSISKKTLRISRKVATNSQVKVRTTRVFKRVNTRAKTSSRRQQSYRWTTKTVR